MTRLVVLCVSLIALAASSVALADGSVTTWQATAAYSWAYPAPYPKDWDRRIGYDFWTRLVNYYALEMGHDGAPPDPTVPPGRRAGWTPPPQSTPPYPFSEWPYGGATNIGVTRPNSVDSPLMTALANTYVGKALNEAHIQIYGWVNFGGNVSTNTQLAGGLHVHTEHGAIRSRRDLRRAPARHGAVGSRRLGVPVLCALR